MKGKIKAAAIIILLAVFFALGVWLAVISINAAIGLTAAGDGFYDSFWTMERAVFGMILSAAFMSCSAAGVAGILLKKQFRYIAYAVLLLFDSAFFIWFLHFYIGAPLTAEDIPHIIINVLGIAATLTGAAIFTVKFVKECKKTKENQEKS